MATKREMENNLIEWVETIPDEFLDCRDLRHQWVTLGSWLLGHGFRGRSLVCRRCGTGKEQILDKKGAIAVSRMSDYPSDYKKPADTPPGRVPAEMLRQEALERYDSEGDVPPQLVAMFDRITGGAS